MHWWSAFVFIWIGTVTNAALIDKTSSLDILPRELSAVWPIDRSKLFLQFRSDGEKLNKARAFLFLNAAKEYAGGHSPDDIVGKEFIWGGRGYGFHFTFKRVKRDLTFKELTEVLRGLIDCEDSPKPNWEVLSYSVYERLSNAWVAHGYFVADNDSNFLVGNRYKFNQTSMDFLSNSTKTF